MENIKIYFAKGSERFGPFTLDEFKKQEVTTETLVWFEGQEKWVKIKDLKDYGDLFRDIPPPISSHVKQNEKSAKNYSNEQDSLNSENISKLKNESLFNQEKQEAKLNSHTRQTKNKRRDFYFKIFFVLIQFTILFTQVDFGVLLNDIANFDLGASLISLLGIIAELIGLNVLWILFLLFALITKIFVKRMPDNFWGYSGLIASITLIALLAVN